jgi:3-oxoacyl-[acyl-carrier protein] reductase
MADKQLANPNSRPTVMITGTSKGVGLELAQSLISKGWSVIGCSRGSGAFESPFYQHLILDLTRDEDVKKCFADFASRAVQIDALVLNAADSSSQLALMSTSSEVERIMSVNFTGSYRVARECGKLMVRQKRGRIIFISSMLVPLATKGSLAYTCSKAAVEQMSRVLAGELASYSITSNVISISLIKTGMWDRSDQKQLTEIVSKLPKKEAACIADVVGIFEFLTAPQNNNVTGQTFYLNGVRG